jgi:hypothetical protein
MPAIMADHDVEGHLQVLQSIWSQPGWSEIWTELACTIDSFERFGIEPSSSDSKVWRLCQERGAILITGNRNAEGDDSLEATIRREGGPNSLPIYTIADPDRLMRYRLYAEQVAARVYDYLRAFDNLRGSGRLYLP